MNYEKQCKKVDSNSSDKKGALKARFDDPRSENQCCMRVGWQPIYFVCPLVHGWHGWKIKFFVSLII